MRTNPRCPCAPVRPASGPQGGWGSLGAYSNMLHYMMMGELILARHHITDHDNFDSHHLTY